MNVYRELHRPQFHFTPARNWMNDPNGLVYFEGEYHLFYQYNPHGDTWGHMSWAHAVSRDLLHWQHLPLALAEEEGVMMFSGSAVVDWKNTSGLGRDGQPPLVALYTGHHTGRPLQNQHLAYSHDRGRTWTKYAGNPVLDIGDAEFRDPKVFWHEPTQRWIMVASLAVQRRLSFYGSPDLLHWTHLSDFGPAGSVTGIWECPDLFPLALDGEPGNIKWVLLLNVNPGAPAGGSGCQYFTGFFDGTQFVADPVPATEDGALWLDYGADCYAAVTWSDVPAADGRRMVLGWMNNWLYGNQLPTTPWRGAMSIPRELTLRSTTRGTRVVQAPVRELATLHQGEARVFPRSDFASAAAWLALQQDLPALLDAGLEFSGIAAGTCCTIDLRLGQDAHVRVRFDTQRGVISVDRTRSGTTDFAPGFAAVHEAPLYLADGTVRIRLLLDTSSVEVFAQDGETVLTDLVFPSAGARRFTLFTEGGLPSGVMISLQPLAAAPPLPSEP